MQELTLNDGNTVPILGLGTYDATGDKGAKAVQMALEKGYRLIDTAAYYENEEAVGKGIKESGVPREEIFVTTKLWRDQLSYEQAKKGFEASRQRLGLDYIDLYLIHWPANAKNYDNWQKANADTWRAMEDLQAEGKIKSIGLSNFWPEHLEALAQTAKVTPAVNQIEFHPGYWQPEVTHYCKRQGITVESWSPLAQGRVLENETIKEIAERHQKTIAQICLRWIVQHEVMVIPKSSNPQRMEENKDIFDFELSDQEMEQIDSLPQTGFSGELPNEWPDTV
ncbi:MAG TPA: aldo/keto reductase [Saprospiraceae bacterium]|nr:aldo/keto reductase [Saprospiraceae bacterium]